jgi:predicted O-methyltransferase YrrM
MPIDPRVREAHGGVWGKLPRLELNQILPGVEAVDISIVAPFDRVLGSTLYLEELASLLGLVKYSGAKKILEIGTFDGSTTLNLAANTPADAQIVTLDLPPNEPNDPALATPKEYQNKTRKTVGEKFRGSPFAKKITQVFGDSAAIDWSELPGPFDLIFIDGCHYYSYVAADTNNALKHIRPGGLIVWHDYSNIKGVADVVDRVADGIAAKAVSGTRLAVGFAAAPAA